MGPRLFSRGYEDAQPRYLAHAALFNGATTLQPWILGVGAGLHPLDEYSSMGPRLFSRGYPSAPPPTWCAARLQWGHDSSAVDTRRRPSGVPFTLFFNGATTLQPWIHRAAEALAGMSDVLQWGHDSSAVDTRRRAPPLGAQKYLQWGHDSSAVDTRMEWGWIKRLIASSMGPRLFSRGYLSVNVLSSKFFQCLFNGATTLQPWIRWISDTARAQPRLFNGATTLQPWIRRRRAANDARRGGSSMGPRLFSRGYDGIRYRIGRGEASSMGPRLFSRGYSAQLENSFEQPDLQWGHDSSAVDTMRLRYTRAARMFFNGATTLQPWILLY